MEYNADAFRLDENAVIDDLLRKLPKLTIWPDGKITVGGKPVNSIYINGKQFLGDALIALQNIPKNVVEKV